MAEQEMMYPPESYGNAKQATIGSGPNMRPIDTTLRKNIDLRIQQAEAEVKKLTETKARLEASGLLDTRIEDLQQAMRW